MDKKAKNILFKTYWKSGWINKKDRHTPPADLAYAKEKGVMFDPRTISHDACLTLIFDILPKISTQHVAKAFLSSLSTRRLDWRSGLSSYFIAKQLTPHQYTKVESGQSLDPHGNVTHISYTCGVCRDSKYGIIGNECYDKVDLNVLNFERIKWGGVRHGDLIYTLFDLEQLQAAVIPDPTTEDIEIFNNILTVIENSLPDDYPGALEKNLATVIKSTKEERQVLIEILACIDILKPTSYDRPTRGKHDWTFVTYWRGEDKYNKEALQQYFGKYMF
ncbi:hypothetical protein HX004_07130 [Myroides sp. 1354]|uniref:hypothetical protein n=1 Tax=unclassified Myroides TaxID=2642485 RepID=UPI002578CBD8|nr:MULTISPECIES: hypothetical protein [unclassified Myroides]MDM1044832.1 hypothetical protein [Myroides sp. R163-1]MDM1055545.1 hypothetical protein [Myroides sp. 1354]MDM1068842.1 hypothetical protein [Myroides sp. 1372]